METTTIEVKFSASDVQEDAKRCALQSYEENNYTLGMLFANRLPQEPDLQHPTQVPGLDFPPEKVSLDRLKALTGTFEASLAALKAGQVDQGMKLGDSHGLIDHKSPVLTFLPFRSDETVATIKQSGSMLPWTSGDSITIIPL